MQTAGRQVSTKNQKEVHVYSANLAKIGGRLEIQTGRNYAFHLAAYFANQDNVDYPETGPRVTGLGILKVLEYANLAGDESLVFTPPGYLVYRSQSP
jgi:hypothetical protein